MAEQGSDDEWEEEDPFAHIGAVDRRPKNAPVIIDPRTIPEDRETLTNILSGGAMAHVQVLDVPKPKPRNPKPTNMFRSWTFTNPYP